MCEPSTQPPHVRLVRCGHGAYHLTVGATTLLLREVELAFVGRAILAMSQSHLTLHAQLFVDGTGGAAAVPAPHAG